MRKQKLIQKMINHFVEEQSEHVNRLRYELAEKDLLNSLEYLTFSARKYKKLKPLVEKYERALKVFGDLRKEQ